MKPWNIFKGGKKLHSRKAGPGITHKQGETAYHLYDSTDLRAATFKQSADDAPKKANRTMPASWGQSRREVRS